MFASNSSINQTLQKHIPTPHTQQHQTAAIIIPATATTNVQVRNPNANLLNYSAKATISWTCPQCQIPFKTASELQTHLSAHTKQEKSVPCTQCGKLFASAERVRIHTRAAHGEKSCACEICGSGFSYRCKLMDHMRTHTGDKPFACESCGRCFSQKNHLRRHSMIHTGERPFPCDICGRGFYRKDKLSRHRRIHLNPSNSNRGRIATPNNQVALANNVTAVSAVTGQQHIVTSLASAPTTIQLIPVSLMNDSSWLTASTSNQNTNNIQQQQQPQQQPQQQQQQQQQQPNSNNTVNTSNTSTPVTTSPS